MTKVILASNNQKKINEMQQLLTDIDLEIIPQSFFNIGEAEEPYQTFVE
ncbi:MAG: non-canonical purine NTP pyrophosphatase, partial [Methylophilaceae bacterium]|nr:non-canonical purine NTP pyrophosphatase [Methylophilaceae bacterium]